MECDTGSEDVHAGRSDWGGVGGGSVCVRIVNVGGGCSVGGGSGVDRLLDGCVAPATQCICIPVL